MPETRPSLESFHALPGEHVRYLSSETSQIFSRFAVCTNPKQVRCWRLP
jgi:hypothetical protein